MSIENPAGAFGPRGPENYNWPPQISDTTTPSLSEGGLPSPPEAVQFHQAVPAPGFGQTPAGAWSAQPPGQPVETGGPGRTARPRREDETAWSTELAEQTGPQQGWRAGFAKLGVRLPKSKKEVEYDRDVLRMRRKLAYPQNVKVMSLKGGVGKSTTAIGIGSALAANRLVSDVVSVDADTDGSLRQRMPKNQNMQVTSDIKRFLHEANTRRLTSSEVQSKLYSNDSGLQALVAAENISDSSLTAEEYTKAISVLNEHYMITIADTAPSRSVATFAPALDSAHALVLVTTPVADSLALTERFLEMLMQSGRSSLLERTVLIWNNTLHDSDVVIDVDRSKNRLVRQISESNGASSCLVEIPRDQHLAAGGSILLSNLRKETVRQFERAAALVMDKLPDWSGNN